MSDWGLVDVQRYCRGQETSMTFLKSKDCVTKTYTYTHTRREGQEKDKRPSRLEKCSTVSKTLPLDLDFGSKGRTEGHR